MNEIEPTVVFAWYGMASSFHGDSGVERFKKGYRRILKSAKSAGARRVVLLTPIPHETQPDAASRAQRHNRKLAAYVDAIRSLAKRRGHPLVDLFAAFEKEAASPAGRPITQHGVQPTRSGYRRIVDQIEATLGLAGSPWRVTVHADGTAEATATTVDRLEVASSRVRFRATDRWLPVEPGGGRKRAARRLTVRGLTPGDYTLRIGETSVRTASAEAWAEGVALEKGPSHARAERLRRAVVRKHRLLQYQRRPLNTEYIYGRRAGRAERLGYPSVRWENTREEAHTDLSAELARFGKLAEKRAEKAATLADPRPRPYELTPADAGG